MMTEEFLRDLMSKKINSFDNAKDLNSQNTVAREISNIISEYRNLFKKVIPDSEFSKSLQELQTKYYSNEFKSMSKLFHNFLDKFNENLSATPSQEH